MRAAGPRLALAALALTGGCAVPTADVVPDKPKPEVTQAEADSYTRRALSYLVIGNKESAYELLRKWSLETNCWTGTAVALFRTARTEAAAFENFKPPPGTDVVSHETRKVNAAMGEGVAGFIVAIDCDRRPGA